MLYLVVYDTSWYKCRSGFGMGAYTSGFSSRRFIDQILLGAVPSFGAKNAVRQRGSSNRFRHEEDRPHTFQSRKFQTAAEPINSVMPILSFQFRDQKPSAPWQPRNTSITLSIRQPRPSGSSDSSILLTNNPDLIYRRTTFPAVHRSWRSHTLGASALRA